MTYNVFGGTLNPTVLLTKCRKNNSDANTAVKTVNANLVYLFIYNENRTESTQIKKKEKSKK